MASSCPGCRKVFATTKAVGTHRRYCEKYQDAPTTILQKRRHDFDRYREAKRRRKEALQIVPIEELPPVPPHVDPVSISILFQFHFVLNLYLAASGASPTGLWTIWPSPSHSQATKAFSGRFTTHPPPTLSSQ